MSYFLNPSDQHPQNVDDQNCANCNSGLLLGDRYRVLKLIGQGGFSRTFLAVDESQPLKPRCVIKQFFPQNSDSYKASELFREEVQRLKSLGTHPQIPTFLDYIEQDEQRYLVQEFISGRNLEQELEAEGPFSEIQIRQLLGEILTVLEFIHSQQVIHRDVKPANIIRRNYNDQLFLVDFGAAKYATGTALVKTGTTIGTAGYTAPEQLMGKPEFASDLYSLGVTCIHLLTQMQPFDLVDHGEGTWVWQDYLTQPISDQLSNILDKLLERGTRKRFYSAAQTLQDLNSQNLSLDLSSVPHASKTLQRASNRTGVLQRINKAVILVSAVVAVGSAAFVGGKLVQQIQTISPGTVVTPPQTVDIPAPPGPFSGLEGLEAAANQLFPQYQPIFGLIVSTTRFIFWLLVGTKTVMVMRAFYKGEDWALEGKVLLTSITIIVLIDLLLGTMFTF